MCLLKSLIQSAEYAVEPSKLTASLLLTVFLELSDIVFTGDFFCDHDDAGARFRYYIRLADNLTNTFINRRLLFSNRFLKSCKLNFLTCSVYSAAGQIILLQY
jgi:hypothetical protein